MKQTGNGLPELDSVVVVQESLNNGSAMQHNPNKPVQKIVSLGWQWRQDIKYHYMFLHTLKRHKKRREDIAKILGVVWDEGKKCFRLPEKLPEAARSLPDYWANKEISKTEYTCFLADVLKISESILRNKLFYDMKRPTRQTVDTLFKELRLDDAHKEDFYHQFGWSSALAPDSQSVYLETLVKQKWGISLNKASEYLLLSSTTMENISGNKKTTSNSNKVKRFHISTLYRFIIAMADQDETVLERMYHNLGLHPIKLKEDGEQVYGESDGIIMVSVKFYDLLVQEFGSGNLEEGSIRFFMCLYTLLLYYDDKFNCSLFGQFFYQKNAEYLLDEQDLPGREE